MRVPFTLLAISLLAGCYSDEEGVGPAVWSDDGTEQLYFHRYWEERDLGGPYGMGHSTKNEEYEVWVQAPSGAGRRVLFPRRAGSGGSVVYYMKAAGYVLMDVPTADGTGWEIVRTSDGSRYLVAEFVPPEGPMTPCQSIEVLPSPDGQLVGIFERIPPAGTGCDGGSYRMQFIDASTLATTATHEMPMQNMPGVMWTRDGDVQVWNWIGGAWLVDPSTGPVTSTVPACQYPRTSSSDLSEAGIRIAAGTLSNPVDVIETGADTCWWTD